MRMILSGKRTCGRLGLIPGWTNTQGLKIIWGEGAAFALISANG